MPKYFVSNVAFTPEQVVPASSPEQAAQKAARFVIRGTEGDAESAFPVWVVELAGEPSQWDAVTTTSVDRRVSVTKHVDAPATPPASGTGG